jgi:hypothetical protein
VDLYIVFAERTGEDENGNYFYRLLFSDDPDIVWGDGFDISPAGIIPEIEPDPQSVRKEFALTTQLELKTAAESTWFSMQDCIDGIISLLFYAKGEPISIPFGMPMDEVKKIIEEFNGEMIEVEYKPKKEKKDGEE